MLASEYHNSHASMLEWIVIILILIEVFFQVLELWSPLHMQLEASAVAASQPPTFATLRFLRQIAGADSTFES